MKKLLISAIVILLLGQYTYGQTDSTSIYSNKNNALLGIGLGLTYGGVGGKLVYNASNNLATFIGLGYNFLAIGFNSGILYYIAPDNQVQGYVSAMYGTNSVIKVENLSVFNGAYIGLSFGAGIILKSAKNPKNQWDLGIIIPVRSSQFKDDWDNIKGTSSIKVQQNPLPILVNLGYNFTLN